MNPGPWLTLQLQRLGRWWPRAKTLGQRGEAAAARFLEKKGFIIVARSDRMRHGELERLVDAHCDRNVGEAGGHVDARLAHRRASRCRCVLDLRHRDAARAEVAGINSAVTRLAISQRTRLA